MSGLMTDGLTTYYKNCLEKWKKESKPSNSISTPPLESSYSTLPASAAPSLQLGREVSLNSLRQRKCFHFNRRNDRWQGKLQPNHHSSPQHVLRREQSSFPIEKSTLIFTQTLFTFNMQTPKGEKQAGVVYVEVASMLNNKMATLSNFFTLEKCPVKDSKVNISITAELVG